MKSRWNVFIPKYSLMKKNEEEFSIKINIYRKHYIICPPTRIMARSTKTQSLLSTSINLSRTFSENNQIKKLLIWNIIQYFLNIVNFVELINKLMDGKFSVKVANGSILTQHLIGLLNLLRHAIDSNVQH